MNSVFDTNILIYQLNDALPESAFDRMIDLLVEGAVIPVITRMETLLTVKIESYRDQCGSSLTASCSGLPTPYLMR